MEQPNVDDAAERRHGARINSEFWVTIRGQDEPPRCLSGNVSVSGLFLYVEESFGPAGSIHELEIATYDRDESVVVMALVIREVTVTDMFRGDMVVGVALGFVFHSPEMRHDVEQFVFQVAMLQGDRQGDLEIHHSFSAVVEQAEVESSDEMEAVVRSLAPDRMVMETEWPLSVGESIQVEVRLPASNKVVGFTGEVKSCDEAENHAGSVRYEIKVAFEEIRNATDQYSAAAVQRALAISEDDDLSMAPVEPTPHGEPFRSVVSEATQAPRKETSALISVYHLRGTLAQMSLTSLLSFLDLERRSGVLSLNIRKRRIQIFMRNGAVVDVERDGKSVDPHALLPGLLELDRGEFEIAFRPVEREDRVDTSTTGLLLELAKRKDESQG